MRLRITDKVLLASSVILSHAVWTGGRFVPIVYRALFRDIPDADIWLIMPTVTRLATDFSFVFIMLIGMVGIGTVVLSRIRTDSSRACLIAGVSGQGLIAWLAAFCFSFGSFTGAMCLHHGPHFELPQFLTTAWGFFPVTLVALLLPLVGAGRELIKNRKPNEQI